MLRAPPGLHNAPAAVELDRLKSGIARPTVRNNERVSNRVPRSFSKDFS